MKKTVAALALGAACAAQAGTDVQSFPHSPVTIIVPVAAGGGLDALARTMAPYLGERWKQPVVVVNRPGVGGWVGAVAAAKSPPDGYTLLIAHDALVISNKFLTKDQPIDLDKDLAPIAPLVQANQMLLAAPSVQAGDLAAFVRLAKANPGKYSYGSYGPGSPPQLAWASLAHNEGLDLLEVPYKGIAPSIQAVLSDEVQLSLSSGQVAGKLMEAGRLKALAVASPQRDPRYPDIKTTAELGYPYLQLSIWHSLFAPGGTPPELTEKIAADVRAVLKNPDFLKKIPDFMPLDGGPAALSRRIAEESKRTKAMIDIAGVVPQ
ncbi:tripartite tricarboxylate transporter substrate binding protein [Pigmentiphaga soli]|uniref:Tripartite tricarboxylate transporter substrate binding protein n=1 Tax=Pigmentiphaga soli TaxID=1007095 RepID=A0ABP8GRX5_9BURK